MGTGTNTYFSNFDEIFEKELNKLKNSIKGCANCANKFNKINEKKMEEIKMDILDNVNINAKDAKISAPWYNYYNEIKELFAKDPEVTVKYIPENYEIKLLVDNSEKAHALDILLPKTRAFGNITVRVTVIPANEEEPDEFELLKTAFSGNGAFEFMAEDHLPDGGKVGYICFAPEVVQYFNDDLREYAGNHTTLYKTIAEDVFGHIPNVYFSTASKI